MEKFFIDQWDSNKTVLQKELQNINIDNLNYIDIVKLVFKYVVIKADEHSSLDEENITEIDNGDYQGMLLYLIPYHRYQPSYDEYLVTLEYYGSCSGCDTLQHIQYSLQTKEEQINDILSLALNIVQNTRYLKNLYSGDNGVYYG